MTRADSISEMNFSTDGRKKSITHTHSERERARNGMEESQFVEYPWIFELCPELKTKRQNGLCPNVKYSIF